MSRSVTITSEKPLVARNDYTRPCLFCWKWNGRGTVNEKPSARFTARSRPTLRADLERCRARAVHDAGDKNAHCLKKTVTQRK